MKDLLGREIKVNDRVAMCWSDGCDLILGNVVRFTAKSVYVKWDRDGKYWPDLQRKPNQLVVIDKH